MQPLVAEINAEHAVVEIRESQHDTAQVYIVRRDHNGRGWRRVASDRDRRNGTRYRQGRGPRIRSPNPGSGYHA